MKKAQFQPCSKQGNPVIGICGSTVRRGGAFEYDPKNVEHMAQIAKANSAFPGVGDAKCIVDVKLAPKAKTKSKRPAPKVKQVAHEAPTE